MSVPLSTALVGGKSAIVLHQFCLGLLLLVNHKPPSTCRVMFMIVLAATPFAPLQTSMKDVKHRSQMFTNIEIDKNNE